MDELNVSTTGLNVTLDDLGVTLTHPTTVNLLDESAWTDIIDSLELENALKAGTLVAVDENGDPVLSSSIGGIYKEIQDAGSQVTNTVIATGSVNADASTNSIVGASVSSIGTGLYRITFNSPQLTANYPILVSFAAIAGNNNLDAKYENVLVGSFDLRVTLQDDGGGGGVPTNAGFSFFVPATTGAFVGLTDHDELQGLGDDDHPQYALTDGSRGNFATTAQGALADTAVQPAQLVSIQTDISNLQGDVVALEAQDVAFQAQQTNQDNAIALNTAKVSFPEAPNDGQQYARQSESWQVVSGGGGGIIPPPSTDNAIVRFDGSSGQVQNSGVFIDDAGQVGIGTATPDRQFHIFDGNLRLDRRQNSVSFWFVRKDLSDVFLKSFRMDNDAFGVNNGEFSISDAGTAVSGAATPRLKILNGGDTSVENNKLVNLGDPTDLNDAIPFKLLDAVKVRNNTTGNLNAGVTTFSSFKTVDELGSTLSQFTFASNGITPLFTGAVRIDFNAELSGAATRATVGFRWSHNGNVGPWTRHTYIRNNSGHNETSANFSTVIPVVAGQPIQIQHDNFAGGGTVTSPEDGMEFVVQRVK